MVTLYISHTYVCMNNHIYSTLYKRLGRKSDRRSKETEQRKNHKTHTHTHTIYIYIYILKYFLKIIKKKTTTEHVTSIYCINIKLSSSLSGLEKYNGSPHWLSSSSSGHLSLVPHHVHAITVVHCASTPVLAELCTGM